MSKSYSPPGYVPPEAKNFKFSPNCIFYKNGDKFFPGSRICISNRFRTLDGFKDDLTKTLLKNQECVRNVYTPIGGTKIKTLDDFKDGEHYVASANDKFTPLPYQEISERQRLHHRRKKGFKKIDIEHIIPPVKHASELYQRKSGRARKDGEKNISLRLKVHLNGENHLPAHVINISRNNRKEMTKICEEIENRMNIPPIVKIFKINGDGYAGERDFKPVLDVEELNKEDHLLACHKFKDKAIFCPYPCNGKDDIRVHTSPRLGQEYNYEIFKMAKSVNRKHNRSLNSYRPLPSIGSSKQSEAQSPFSNAGSYGGRKKNPKSRTKQVDYDRDDHGGVYRAKKQNNAYGAQQERVNEDAAATKIQAGARGYQTRKRFRAEKEAMKRDQNEADRRRQEESRRFEEEEEEERRRQADAKQKKAMDEDLAAAKIQASFKGYKTRKEVGLKKQQGLK